MRYFDPAAQASSLAELYDEALDVVQDAVMCDGISIFELSKDGAFLDFAATRTLARDLLQGLKLQVGTAIVGQVAERGEGILCCPLRHCGRLVAVVELVNKVDGEPFSDGELASVQILADSAAGYWRGAAVSRRRESFYQLTRMLRRVVDVEGISIFTLDAGQSEMQLRFSDTTRKIDFAGKRLTVDQGVAGAVARLKKPLLVADVHQETRFFRGIDAVSLFSTHSLAAAPVVDAGRVLGVVEVVNAKGSESFTEDDVTTLADIVLELAPRMGLWV